MHVRIIGPIIDTKLHFTAILCPLMYQSWNFFNTFESQSTNVSYLDFGLKPAVFSCLNNALAPQLIVLESCSSSQTDQPVV